jgi:transcription elongation GreA/GreB family factor
MIEEVFLPPQGIDHIRQRLEHLEMVEARKIAQKMASLVDRASPAFIILTEMQQEVDQEIRQLKRILANAVVVENRVRA